MLAARGGLLIVDEAFADVTPDLSVAGQAGTPGLCVLRSFGKFFGLAGLAAGLRAGDCGTGARGLKNTSAPGPLPVRRWRSAPAPWMMRTGSPLPASVWRSAARDLDALLERHGLAVVGGTDLFRLARTPHAAALYEHLGRQGILVRSFDAKPDWLRFGLPPDAAAWERLRAALASFNLAA